MIENLRLFYEENGVNYDQFLRRLMGKEVLVRKYTQLFLEDSTYSELKEAVQKQDYDLILSKAHTLKGVAMNIELNTLSGFASNIVSSIRGGKTEEVDELFCQLQQEYERIAAALNA